MIGGMIEDIVQRVMNAYDESGKVADEILSAIEPLMSKFPSTIILMALYRVAAGIAKVLTEDLLNAGHFDSAKLLFIIIKSLNDSTEEVVLSIWRKIAPSVELG